MRHCLAAIGLGALSALTLSGCAEQPGKSQGSHPATSGAAKSHGLQSLGTSDMGNEVYYTEPQRMSSYLVTIVVFVPPGSSLEEIVGDPANSGVLVFDCHGGFAPSFAEPTMLIPRGSVVGALEAAICRSGRP